MMTENTATIPPMPFGHWETSRGIVPLDPDTEENRALNEELKGLNMRCLRLAVHGAYRSDTYRRLHARRNEILDRLWEQHPLNPVNVAAQDELESHLHFPGISAVCSACRGTAYHVLRSQGGHKIWCPECQFSVDAPQDTGQYSEEMLSRAADLADMLGQ